MSKKRYVKKDPHTVSVTNNLNNLDSLLKRTHSISQISLLPTQQTPWIEAYINSFSTKISSSNLVYVERGANNFALATLCKERGFFKMFELPGVRLLLEPSDFIYSDKTTLDILIDKLAKLKTPLSLYRLPGHSLVPAALKRAYKGKAKVVMLDYKNYPFIDLCDTDISRILSSRMRQDIRRAQRKAEKYGEISFDIQSPRNESEFAAMFNDLLFVESKSWKGKAGSALAFDPDRRRFYYEYGIRSCERGALRMCFMRINSQPVAAQLAIEEEKRFWLLKTGYCDNYANCSPGNLLMHETLKYALSKGLLSYEFLGAAEKWTKRWTSAERNSLSVAVYPYNLNGLLAIIGDGFRYLWVKRLKYPINRLINNIYSYRRS